MNNAISMGLRPRVGITPVSPTVLYPLFPNGETSVTDRFGNGPDLTVRGAYDLVGANDGWFTGSAKKTITGAADNGGEIQLTVTGHGWSTGDWVITQNGTGVSELDWGEFQITVDDANTITLDGSDATNVGNYTTSKSIFPDNRIFIDDNEYLSNMLRLSSDAQIIVAHDFWMGDDSQNSIGTWFTAGSASNDIGGWWASLNTSEQPQFSYRGVNGSEQFDNISGGGSEIRADAPGRCVLLYELVVSGTSLDVQFFLGTQSDGEVTSLGALPTKNLLAGGATGVPGANGFGPDRCLSIGGKAFGSNPVDQSLGDANSTPNRVNHFFATRRATRDATLPALIARDLLLYPGERPRSMDNK